VKRRTSRYDALSRTSAVDVASMLMIGLSMVTDRLLTMPIAASMMTSSGSRLMAAAMIGPSAVIRNQLAKRGSQNQKMSR